MGAEAGLGGRLPYRAVRGAWHLTIGNLGEALGGYLYWVLVSALVGPGEVGVASAVAGVGTLLGTLLVFGVNQSVQRFLGECEGRGDPGCSARIFSSALGLGLPVYALAGILLVAYGAWLSGAKFTFEMAVWSAVLVVFWGLSLLARSAVIALLRTSLDLTVTLAGTAARILVGVVLVMAGYGWQGIVAGLAVPLAMRSIVLGLSVARTVGLARPDPSTARSMVAAGLTVWLPNALHTAGWWLGVVTVYGYGEPVDAGLYYIATMVASVVNSIAASVSSIILPALARVPGEERLGLASRAIVATYWATVPVTTVLIVFPEPVLGLIGPEYVEASPILRVVALGLLAQPAAILAMQYSFSMSRYRRVLGLGFAINGPRLVLYPPLASQYGGLGAAASLTAGSLVGLASAIVWERGLARTIVRALAIAACVLLYALGVRLAAGGGLAGVALAGVGGYVVPVLVGLVSREEALEVLEPVLAWARGGR